TRYAVVVRENLGAIVNRNARRLAEVFVMSRFIRILKTPPTAYVIDQNGPKRKLSINNVLQKLLQPRPVRYPQPAFCSVGVGLDDEETVFRCVSSNRIGLVG